MKDFRRILSMIYSSTMLAPRWFDRRQRTLGSNSSATTKKKQNNHQTKTTTTIIKFTP
jgi:hypothetical protein